MVVGLLFSPDGKNLTVAEAGGGLNVWEPATGRKVRTIPFEPAKGSGNDGFFWAVDYSPDGGRIVLSIDNGTIQIRDALSGHTLQVLRGHSGAAERLAFSPDGKRLASLDSDHQLKLWDVTTGDECLTMVGPNDGPLCFSPDGHLLATGEGNLVTILDATPERGDVP
jgi:WD40 repeat protein